MARWFPEEDEPFADCEYCGSTITVGEYNRTGTTAICDSCPELMCWDCELPEEQCVCDD
jgi:hypothetical protein